VAFHDGHLQEDRERGDYRHEESKRDESPGLFNPSGDRDVFSHFLFARALCGVRTATCARQQRTDFAQTGSQAHHDMHQQATPGVSKPTKRAKLHANESCQLRTVFPASLLCQVFCMVLKTPLETRRETAQDRASISPERTGMVSVEQTNTPNNVKCKPTLRYARGVETNAADTTCSVLCC